MRLSSVGFSSLMSVVVAVFVGGAAFGQGSGAVGPQQGPKYPAQGPTWQSVEPLKSVPPPVKIEPEVMDLGDLMPNAKVPAEFKITNIGTEALEITAAMSTCHCTVPQLGEKKIEPGASIVLPITFDSGPVLTNQEREVVIRFAGYSRAAAGRVRASTNYGIRTDVEFTPPEQRRVGVVMLRSVSDRPFRVLSANGEAAEFVDGFDSEKDSPRAAYEVRFDLSEYAAEALPEWFVLETDHPTSPIIDIPVENLEWEPQRSLMSWGFGERRVLMGTMPVMGRREVVVTVQNMHAGPLDFVKQLWVEPEVADATMMGMEKTEDGLKVRVRVTPKDSHRGLLVAKLMIAGADHEAGVWLMGRVAAVGGE